MFLDLVVLARKNDDYSDVWPAFLEGFWCVLVEPLEQPVNGQDFRFFVREFGPGKEPTIFVAEKAEQLARADVRHSIHARGSDLLALLHAEVGIAVLLENGEVLGMPSSLVGHLRNVDATLR